MPTNERRVAWCVVEHKANRDVPRVVFDSCEAARELAKEWNEAKEIGLLDPYYGVEEVLLGDENWLERTCTFTPDVYLSGDDGEDTNDPAEGCMAFRCSECDGAMMYGEGGSWFDTEPPYTPRFTYCPHCGAKVARNCEDGAKW